ncbi:MAG TPA: hypothetical protein VMO24_03975 [Woeseiaceae bacterium]|nr:hypothetical protein [Woeseiaceae bacterium]
MSERASLAFLPMALGMVVAAISPPLLAQDSAGEIALSEESIQLRYIRELQSRELQSDSSDHASQLGFGLFWTESRDFVASGNYYVEASRLRFDRLTLLAGPVAYAAMLNTENTDVFSLAIGAEVRFELLSRLDLDLVGRAAYAPDILTFGSADQLWDVTVRAELPLTDRITGLGGYRLFEIDLLQGTNELEESIHLGMRYQF